MENVECQMMMEGIALTLNEMSSAIEEVESGGNIMESGSAKR